jgi:hypothetical protein
MLSVCGIIQKDSDREKGILELNPGGGGVKDSFLTIFFILLELLCFL